MQSKCKPHLKKEDRHSKTGLTKEERPRFLKSALLALRESSYKFAGDDAPKPDLARSLKRMLRRPFSMWKRASSVLV